MDNTVKIEKFFDEGIYIDVRSPSEFKSGTIKNAINIPLLDDKERAEVGTMYVQGSKQEAKRMGIEFVTKKLLKMFDEVVELKNTGKPLVCFCARGGYRSKAFSSFFTSIGVNVFRVDGGYKSYRKYVKENMPKLCDEFTFMTLHGNTGVGKTDILHELSDRGEAILDIEGCANHRGSLLGSIGIGDCNTQKGFENELFFELLDAVKRGKKYVFTEAESKTVGKCKLPEFVYSKMQTDEHIFIDSSYEYRAASLERDYVRNENWQQESIDALDAIRKYMSNAVIEKLQDKIREGEFKSVAIELMKSYYDPMYEHKSNKFKYLAKYQAITSPGKVAEEIIIDQNK